MDKSWMFASRMSQEYLDGVDAFLEHCKTISKNIKCIKCPCQECGNTRCMGLLELKEHLTCNGVDQSYKIWKYHGEPDTNNVPTENNIFDGDEPTDCDDSNFGRMPRMFDDMEENLAENPNEFEELLASAEKPIYPDCVKFTKLSTLVRLFNLKARYSVSDKCFSELLSFLEELLPEGNEIPKSMYEAKKTLSTLGMDYEKYHACPNDCILYRNEWKDSVCCPICEVSRWKKKKNSNEDMVGIPAKALWYIPIIPRLIRLFRNPNHAKSLTWHANERVEDGKLRHPADAPAWKKVDDMWPEFAAESRNIRFGLCTDGINPHRSLSSRYSCWPVILVIYNLPPGLCMKRRFMLLSLVISGSKQPGNDIDVYLAPLIDDLKLLWRDGVKARDGFRGDDFILRAVLLWTINDLPAYGNLSGCSVKGYFGCPICQENTCSKRLKHSSKIIYDGHRRFLPLNHPYRRWKKAFNGEQELGVSSPLLTGIEIEEKLSKLNFKPFGKIPKNSGGKKLRKRRRKEAAETTEPKCWKKNQFFSN